MVKKTLGQAINAARTVRLCGHERLDFCLINLTKLPS
jgi:hypothetical protein